MTTRTSKNKTFKGMTKVNVFCQRQKNGSFDSAIYTINGELLHEWQNEWINEDHIKQNNYWINEKHYN